jgi:FkbM family methyltransferase
MYSQNDEEKVILEYFADFPEGRFLDIGAYDGVTLSNTRALARAGWTGVLVEPSPFAFVSLAQLYKDQPDITLVNAAITLKHQFQLIHCSPLAPLSTLEKSAFQTQAKNTPSWIDFYLPTLSVENLLGLIGPDIDFLSLDTEGSSADLLSPILERCDPALVCVEHEGLPGVLENILGAYDLYTIALTPENLIAARQKSCSE